MERGETTIGLQDRNMTFEEVYNRYYLSVYLYLLKRVQNREDTEDLTSDVFLACYQNFERYDPERASLATWIFVIASNRLKNYYRDRKPAASLDDEDFREPAGEDDLEQAAVMEELRGAVREAIRNLPERQQTIVRMRYFSGLNSNEIAARTGLTSGNVRAVLSRTLTKLRNYLEDYYFEINF